MNILPDAFATYVRGLLEESAWNVETERKALLNHLHRWRVSPKKTLPLPGYCAPPRNAPGKNHPPGWTNSNFHHLKNFKSKRHRAGITH